MLNLNFLKKNPLEDYNKKLNEFKEKFKIFRELKENEKIGRDKITKKEFEKKMNEENAVEKNSKKKKKIKRKRKKY